MTPKFTQIIYFIENKEEEGVYTVITWLERRAAEIHNYRHSGVYWLFILFCEEVGIRWY